MLEKDDEMGKKCKWQKKLEEMERTERFYNKTLAGEDRLTYEEDMELDYWRWKKLVRKKAQK